MDGRRWWGGEKGGTGVDGGVGLDDAGDRPPVGGRDHPPQAGDDPLRQRVVPPRLPWTPPDVGGTFDSLGGQRPKQIQNTASKNHIDDRAVCVRIPKKCGVQPDGRSDSEA